MGYDRHACSSIGEGELKMSGRYPEIVYTAEGMREGMQIEDANIPIDAKVALLDSTNASFGSNFLGDFPVEAALKLLEKEHELWDAAGIKVTAVSVDDPMGWCHPVKIEGIFGRNDLERASPPPISKR